MVNKTRKRAKKQKPDSNASPNPPAESPVPSPLKVLVSSSKCNVSDEEPEPSTQRQRAVKSFNENIQKFVDSSGTLHLDDFLNSGLESDSGDMENQPIFVFVSDLGPDEKEPNGDQMDSTDNISEIMLPPGEPSGVTHQMESSGNSTDTANDDMEMEINFEEERREIQPDPQAVSPAPPESPPRPKPLKTYGEEYRNLNRMRKRAIRTQLPDPIPTTSLDQRYITLSPSYTQPSTPPQLDRMQLTPIPSTQQHNDTFQTLVQSDLEQKPIRTYNLKCAQQSCSKKPTVACPGCNMLVFCTERHRKTANKNHIQFCNGFRIVDSQPFGRHAIANRDVKKSGNVLTDEPVVVLPLNPSLTSREFSLTYCIKCFKDSVADRTGRTNKLCSDGCELPICDKACAFSFCNQSNREYNRVQDHTEAECKLISASMTKEEKKRTVLICDQSLIGLIRLMRCANNVTEEMASFVEVTNTIPVNGDVVKRSINFESKLKVIRNLFHVDESSAEDKDLYRIDQALLKYARNITNDSIQWKEGSDAKPFNTFFRCLYPKLSSMIHSCTPNNLLYVSNNLSLQMTPVVDLKKGEVLSISYDDRCLWFPTPKRRSFLQSQFGFTCKCKRCVSSTELNSHFSSYPCSNCPGFIVPENPLEQYSDWFCSSCKHVTVSYIRIIDTEYNLEDELDETIKMNYSLPLLDLMNELVNGNFLHWNHNLIFNASVKMFAMLWEELCSGDETTTLQYSKYRGQQFLSAAEGVINITKMFMPNCYSASHVLPLRVAAIIKLRHLTNQLARNATSVTSVNQFILDTYLRSISIDHTPLYNRHPNVQQSPKDSERNLKILELRILDNLIQQVKLADVTPKHKQQQNRDIVDMWEAKKRGDEYMAFLKITNDTKRGFIGFPWDFQV